MNKEKIREKVGKKGNRKYLSAQDYAKFSDEEKGLLKEALEEDDDFEYEATMKALWPKRFEAKPLRWGKHGNA